MRPESTWDMSDGDFDSDFAEKFKDLDEQVTSKRLRQKEKYNLSPKERKAIKTLRSNTAIVIKPADKGATIVIMDKDKYIAEGERQLSNEQHYRKITKPVHPEKEEDYINILHNIKEKKLLNKRLVECLEPPPEPRERKFYLLPKIHKEQAKWSATNLMPPGRPIVSDCSSDTYNISKYIDYYLGPLATLHPSYIKDTSDFLQKLSQTKVKPDSFLITLDVDSLYTNINNQAGLRATQDSFTMNPDDRRPDEELMKLLTNCLENNDFVFNKQWYLQVGGTAMGKKFAPNYANIFMANWEKEALAKCTKQPQVYFRYLDDIFLIWPHSLDDFQDFFNTLNSHEPTIKLKQTISDTSINFLDVTVYKGGQFQRTKQLDTKVFFKPTDTHELLHRDSYHPKHTFRSIIKSQLIRYYRICTHEDDFQQACSILFSTLRFRGYSHSFLRKIKRDTLFTLNTQGGTSSCGQTRCTVCAHILETNTILDSNRLPIALQHKLDCNSTFVVYMIQCENCNIRYVGKTSRKLKERIHQHRSDINNYVDTPVANHFTQICPNREFLRVIALDQIDEITCGFKLWPEFRTRPLTRMQDLMERTSMGIENDYLLLLREDYWIKRLRVLSPHGLNLRTEMGPPIPFTIKYSDYAPTLAKHIKGILEDLKSIKGYYRKYKIIAAFKRNKNLRDLLVSANLQ